MKTLHSPSIMLGKFFIFIFIFIFICNVVNVTSVHANTGNNVGSHNGITSTNSVETTNELESVVSSDSVKSVVSSAHPPDKHGADLVKSKRSPSSKSLGKLLHQTMIKTLSLTSNTLLFVPKQIVSVFTFFGQHKRFKYGSNQKSVLISSLQSDIQNLQKQLQYHQTENRLLKSKLNVQLKARHEYITSTAVLQQTNQQLKQNHERELYTLNQQLIDLSTKEKDYQLAMKNQEEQYNTSLDEIKMKNQKKMKELKLKIKELQQVQNDSTDGMQSERQKYEQKLKVVQGQVEKEIEKRLLIEKEYKVKMRKLVKALALKEEMNAKNINDNSNTNESKPTKPSTKKSNKKSKKK